ncbi:MAG: polysaccharide pyruvyl transferase family protein [Candidatus Bathyarchaeota archaeon]|nr:polysaccharide pyruvyl transferase family protein [Candidatus Bathyarchaeota archaeon]
MDAFESFLADHKDDKIFTITPGGNHGDTLIHMGMVKKLEELGCEFQCLNLEEAYKRRVVLGAKYLANIAAWRLGVDRGFDLIDVPGDADLILFDGGGYMNDIWYGLVLLKQVLKRHRLPIAVGPQSYWFEATDFMSLFADDRPVTLFCREPYSRDLLSVKPRPPQIEVLMSKDTALYLDQRYLDSLAVPSEETYDLVCFRRDKETIIPRETKREIIEQTQNPMVDDISKKGLLRDFVSTVANARRIHTDRLHVAILAHILGKETTLYDNRYHKNRGVYEYSMRHNPMIRFVESSGDNNIV